jgi:hypothetical protein
MKEWIGENFTWHRWRVNPFQMYFTAFLLLASTAQLGFGVAPTSPTVHLYDNTQAALAFCAFWGVLTVLFGLHLKDIETGLWVEVCGYVPVMFVEGISVYLMFTTQVIPFASHNFAFDQAMVYASLQRSIQIWLYKRARRRALAIGARVEMLKEVLRADGLDPDRPVFGGTGDDDS